MARVSCRSFAALAAKLSSSNGLLRISEEVRQALAEKRPVVALESTVITHGMPQPENHKVATNLEAIVRKHACTPATIALLSGKICIGLSASELQQIAEYKSAIKISRRDISFAVSQKHTGGTTVAATMLLAHAAGIPILATGGCGGVHRGVETSFDVSADLRELGRTPVAVVCSGIKSILDVEKTLEVLNRSKQNDDNEKTCIVWHPRRKSRVPVLTFGATSDFPGFFKQSSGFLSQAHIESTSEIASIIATQINLGLQTGLLIAVPIPDGFESLARRIDDLTNRAVEKARASGVKGHNETPFLLSEVNHLTDGESLKANIALIENNASVAAQIAHDLSLLKSGSSNIAEQSPHGLRKLTDSSNQNPKQSTVEVAAPIIANANDTTSQNSDESSGKPTVVIVGGITVDYYAKAIGEIQTTSGQTFPGLISESLGGVARNHADALTQLGCSARLISAVGSDFRGDYFRSQSKHLDLSAVSCLDGESTSTYASVISRKGDVMFGLMDMRIHDTITPQMAKKYQTALKHSKLGVIDGNVPVETLTYFVNTCASLRVPVWFEPTDRSKVQKLLQANCLGLVSFLSPNKPELGALLDLVDVRRKHHTEKKMDYGAASAKEDRLSMETSYAIRRIYDVATKLQLLRLGFGDEGALVTTRQLISRNLVYHLIPKAKASPNNDNTSAVVNVSGAGDCLNAGIIYGIVNGWDLLSSCRLGHFCSHLSLQCSNAVPPNLASAAKEFMENPNALEEAGLQIREVSPH